MLSQKIEEILSNSRDIAKEWHKGQYRKFGSQREYIEHPIEVAEKVESVGGTYIEIAASNLHDVAEDVALPQNSIGIFNKLVKDKCGAEVLKLVWEITNRSDFYWFKRKYINPRRHEKFSVNIAHIRKISNSGKLIKLADRLCNLKDMYKVPKKFMDKYIPESFAILEACRGTCKELEEELEDIIEEYTWSATIKKTLEDCP